MNIQTSTPVAPDFAAMKARQHGAWSSGDYAVVGTTLQIVGETLCEALNLHAGHRVLDVAAQTPSRVINPSGWVRFRKKMHVRKRRESARKTPQGLRRYATIPQAGEAYFSRRGYRIRRRPTPNHRRS